MNPECDCGETLWLEPTRDQIWMWVPGSPEIRQLFLMDAAGIKLVWVCLGCGFFMAAVKL